VSSRLEHATIRSHIINVFRVSTAIITLAWAQACVGGNKEARPAPPPPAISSFKAFFAPIRENESARLKAVFSDGKGIVTPGNLPMASGVPLEVRPLETTIYTLTVTDSAGTAVAETASVVVLPAGTPVVSLAMAVPSSVGIPEGLALDREGSLYLAHPNSCDIRKVTRSGKEVVLAGKTNAEGNIDGPDEAARFRSVHGMALDESGNLYAGDLGNSTIRKITPEGMVSTLAGVTGPRTGSVDGVGVTARFIDPWALSVDRDGNIYVGDTGACVIRKITPYGVASTLAGKVDEPGSKDGQGDVARFSQPMGIDVDTSGNVFVADMNNCVIRKITPGGDVTTLAGTAGESGAVDGMGPAARFSCPCGVAVDRSGDVYVADSGNSTIRKITAAGVVSTVVGVPGRPGFALGRLPGLLNLPSNVVIDPATGNLFICQPGAIVKVQF